MVKRGLGRGFASLIPTDVVDSDFDITAAEDEKLSAVRLLNLADIIPNPDQPRRNFKPEELRELADSIAEHGLLQPIVVTPGKVAGQFEIVAGERRYRAAKLAGLDKVSAIVRKLSDQHKLELAIVENVQREDLNPLETATAYAKLRTQFNMPDDEIARRVGRATSTIRNNMRLLNLPDEAKQALAKGELGEAHARQILALPTPELKHQLLRHIIDEGWTVNKAERFVIGYKRGLEQGDGGISAARQATRTQTPWTDCIAKRLGFSAKNVSVKTTAHGGQLIIKYRDDADLAKITEIMGLKK